MAGARKQAIALTIAGSDSSGGAGIQADLKTFSAFGVYGASVVTAITAQNTHGVTAVHGVPVEVIAQQFQAVASDLEIGAIKTGMLGDRATVIVVAAALLAHGPVPLVVDPVMVATSGDVLLDPNAIDAVRTRLIPLATLITPNLPEAACLLDVAVAASLADMERQALRLLDFGARAVLVKGGHKAGEEAIDVLAAADGITRLAAPRLAATNTHGTGCTLSAAIAAGLALGDGLTEAVTRAKDFVWRAIESGADLAIGSGRGPVDHLVPARRR